MTDTPSDPMSQLRMAHAPRVIAETGDYQVWRHKDRIMLVHMTGKGVAQQENTIEMSLTSWKTLARRSLED